MTNPRILLVQLGRLGDFVLATPMLRALRQTYPSCRIHVLASRHNAALAQMQPEIERVFVYSKKFFDTVKMLIALKQEYYHWWIDPKDHFSREGKIFAQWARAHVKVGFNQTGGKNVFDVGLLSQEEHHTHVARRNLEALRAFGITTENLRPSLFVPSAAQEEVAFFLRSKNVTQYYCVNLSAGNAIRYWPQSQWIKFLQTMQAEAPAFVLTTAPHDEPLAAELLAQVPRSFYFPTRGLSDLLAVLQRAELVISPDTSIIHMAAAFDRPVLGLYSNHEWNYKKFYPLSTHRRIVLPAAPGGLIKDIPCENVLEKFYELLTDIREVR